MKVDTGNCTSCGAKNSKFVEKCYKCQALLPWATGYQAPAAPPPPAVVTPPPAPVPKPLPAPATPQQSYSPPSYQPQAQPMAPVQPMAPPPQVWPEPQAVVPAYPPVYPAPMYPAGPPGGMRPMPMGPMICQTCGYSGMAQTFMQGSVVWGVILCFLWLVPGILYFIWQSTTKYDGCPQCRGRAMVPLHSPEGQYSAHHFYGM